MNPAPELDVVVIGAGQAGLSTGYHLGRAGLRYELLDGHSRVGDSWRLTLSRLRQAGVNVVPRLSETEGTTAHFADGAVAEIRALVWATGYRVDSDWLAIPAARSPDGAYVHSRGISPVDGVYFVGQSWQWTRGSALLTGVNADAAYVTAEIARRLSTVGVTCTSRPT